MYNSKSYWTVSYFSFYNYWKYFNFCFCFFAWYSYRNYEFCIGLIVCAITAGIKKYKLIIIKKKKNKHNKIVLLAKSKLNCKEVLISKALVNSNISHDEFVLGNNVLKEYNFIIFINSKIKRLNHRLDLPREGIVFDRTRQFIKDFSLFIN